jgi:phosphoglycerate dehydrogenase-like enzyme
VQPRIFVVQPIPEPALEMMRAVADVEVFPFTDRMVSVDELVGAVQRNDYVFAMHETMIPKEVIEANPNLKGIGVGVRDYEITIDVAACEAAGIPILVEYGEGYDESRRGNAKATADLTLTMMLCLAYRVVESDIYTKHAGFRQEMTMDLMGLGVTGKTAGVIGMGYVARELVPRLQAFEMNVLYSKRTRLDTAEEKALGISWAEIDSLIEQSDYVVMLADYNQSSFKMMGAREFALMKPGAYFINTGRGRLVDEAAMIAALEAGTIAGAGLDVFYDEPPVVTDPFVAHALRKMENVVLAPHNGGATWDSRGSFTKRIAKVIVDAIERDFAPA